MEDFKFVSALDSDKKNVYLFFADEVDIDKKKTTATFGTEWATNNAVEVLKNGSCLEHDILPAFKKYPYLIYYLSDKLEEYGFIKQVAHFEGGDVEFIESKKNYWTARKLPNAYQIVGFTEENFVE